MGKGDRKTGKGKRFMGSFGNSRKRENKSVASSNLSQEVENSSKPTKSSK